MIQRTVQVTFRCDFTGCVRRLDCEDYCETAAIGQALQAGWSAHGRVCRCPQHKAKCDVTETRKRARAAAGGAR